MRIRNLFTVLAIFAGIHHANSATVFPIATNPAVVQISGGIASSGSNYLVSFLSGTNVCAQLVSASGALSGIAATNGHSKGTATFGGKSAATFPFVAYAGTNYLQVWYDSAAAKTYGRTISRNGTPAASAFQIGNTVALALASDHTNCLVVLADNDRNLYGQFVSSSGSLSGSAFLISSQIANSATAAAAFGATNYLVIWSSQNVADEGGTNLAYGAFISPEGAVDGPFQIGETPAPDYGYEAVAFDGANFLAAWTWDPYPEATVETNWEVFGRLVSQTGAFASDEFQLVTEAGNDNVPLACV